MIEENNIPERQKIKVVQVLLITGKKIYIVHLVCFHYYKLYRLNVTDFTEHQLKFEHVVSQMIGKKVRNKVYLPLYDFGKH